MLSFLCNHNLLHKLQHHNKILELAELFQCDCSAQMHISSILIFCYLHYFNYYVWWPTNVTAKPHGKHTIPHGKTKNLTARTKYLTAKPKTSRQKQKPHGNKKPHGKTKYLTAKANIHGKTKANFTFAVKYLVLPWGFWFRRVVFGFVVTVVGHHNYGYCDSYPRELFLGLLSLPCAFTNIMLQWLLWMLQEYFCCNDCWHELPSSVLYFI